MRSLYYYLYFYIGRFLPVSYNKFGGISKSIRYFLVSRCIQSCGKEVNIEQHALFSTDLKIGDYSGIGINAKISQGVEIGNDVMMAPNVTILTQNHETTNTDIPMRLQASAPLKKVKIEDDVWIGQNVIILPGVIIRKGTIIGAGAVVTKSFEPFSVIGGNPARLIKSRLK